MKANEIKIESIVFKSNQRQFVCPCKHESPLYDTPTIAKRMAKVHLIRHHGATPEPNGYVKKDGTITPPAGKKPRKQQRAVNFCPCCGTNLRAIEVAISL